MMLRHSILTLLLVLPMIVCASAGDSLKILYDNAKGDSLKARRSFDVADHYVNIDVEIAIKWGDRGLEHAKKFKDELFIVKSLVYASYYYNRKGNYHEQIKLCLEALKIADQNNYNEQKGTIASNIGGAYLNIGDNDQALKWLMDAIELKKKYSTKEKLAYSLGSLGAYYFQQGDFKKAIAYHEESLNIRQESEDPEATAINLANLADCYIELKEFNKAEMYLENALSIRRSFEDDYGVTKTIMDFAHLHDRKEEYRLAIIYADSSFELASQNGYDDLLFEDLVLLANLHRSIKDFKSADDYRIQALELWRNLFSKEASYNLNELRTIYETEQITNENLILKKQKEIDDLNNLKNKEANSKLRLIIIMIVLGMIVLSAALFLFVRLNRSKRISNIQLIEQKKIVEIKNEEILDSINYARRIQSAILPSIELIHEILNDVFIVYRPKDVVAGDFYWLETKNNWNLFAVADCTGHGVPGAMVSVFGNNALNRAVREHGLTDPGQILDRAREIMISEFEKNDEEVRDGMDISLCALQGNTLLFAGAYNSLWIVRHGELLEYRGDKQPIGLFDKTTPFSTTQIELQKDDCIYLFTDGFADQFGGADNKKFKSANLKRLLVSVNNEPMTEQALKIQNTFDSWKDGYEQVDDVCLMGIRYKG